MKNTSEIKALEKLLTNPDVELQNFAKSRLEELEDSQSVHILKSDLDFLLDLHKLAKTGRLHMLSESLLIKCAPALLLPDPNPSDLAFPGDNVFHIAARKGYLNHLPNQLRSVTNLRSRNKDGNTCLHLAATYGHLNQIQKDILTDENVLVRNHNGDTVLHSAANGGFNLSLSRFMTQENLMKKNNRGNTVLHEAARLGSLSQIPREFLTEPNLLNVGASGHTVFEASGYGIQDKDIYLGIEFSDAVRKHVGDTWYRKNCELCAAQKAKSGIIDTTSENEVELF